MDFYTKLNTGYFMMQDVQFPEKPKKDLVKIASGLYAKEMLKYNSESDAYYMKKKRREAEFKSEALNYCGLKNHKKADKAFALAWEKGHSNGYHEVVNELLDLANLLN